MPDINFVVKNGLTVNGAFTANSTVVNAAAITATSLNAPTVNASSVNATSVNTATANATTSIVVGGNVSINTAAFFVSNTLGNTTTTAGLLVINGGAFRANSTVVNAAAVIATSVNSTSVNTATANATTSLVVGGNVVVNTTTFFVNNASVNTNITAGQISLSGVTVNSTIYQGTANNANNLGGVSAASYQTTAGLAANVVTLTANAAGFLGTVAAASYVNSAQLSSNLSNYAALAGASFAGQLSVSNNVTITGNLIVTGTTMYANVTNLDVKDLNITVAKGVATAAAADGAGITVDTANVTWNYNHATISWQSNVSISPASNNTLNLGSPTLNWANVNANNVVSANLYGTIRTASQPNITAGNASNLNSQPASFYTNATNITTGTLPAAQLSGSYNISANNANNLGGQAPSYYTNIPARLGYTPANIAGDTFTGGVVAPSFKVDSNQFYYMRSDGAVYMSWNGTNISFNQPVSVTGGMSATGGYYTGTNIRADGIFYGFNDGPPAFGATGGSYVFFRWDGTNLKYNVDNAVERDIYYFGASDSRLKENIANSTVDSLQAINSIHLREFDWNQEGQRYHGLTEENKHVRVGVVAQEIEENIPESVFKTTMGSNNAVTRLFKPDAIVPYLIGAIQQQQKQIDELKQLLASR